MTIILKSILELSGRATQLAGKKFLPVNYYRIRKRLAVPLPIAEVAFRTHSVRAFSSQYPWNIWLMWALEDRILVLGEFVCQTNDATAQTAVEADLLALASWQTFRESDRPDLCYAHAVRILCVAFNQWSWVSEDLRSALQVGLQRAIDDSLPLSNQTHGNFDSLIAILASEKPHLHLHNIPLIGTCALAMAAKVLGHPAARCLDARMTLLFTAVLELRQSGFSEGVSYDGYVLNFVADWLQTVDEASRKIVLEHPCFTDMAEQVFCLAAPGDVMATAPLGDVEPVEMPFVWSALAKLQALQPNARVAWALSLCDVTRLRADALVALARMPAQAQEAPAAEKSPVQLNYALVLRSGFSADDIAVAMGLSTSPMGHIQCDNGSLVLGTRGRWWLDDPGYQQYLQTSERRFTVGPAAHNAPVINGHAQAYKQPSLVTAVRLTDSPDVQFALVNLAACYPVKAGVHHARRAIWLVGDAHLVVCDEIGAAAPASLGYHWHGHPSLYWCLQDGAATMVAEDEPDRWLHVFSPQIELRQADLHRLPGSRGQQTLALTLYPPQDATVWWVFSFAAQRPGFLLTDKAFLVGGREVQIHDELLPLQALKPISRAAPLVVTASRQGNTVTGRCIANAQHFSGELEYAFYLMVGGKKAMVHWYGASPEASFTLPDSDSDKPLEVRGFVRERANPAKKLMQAAEVVPDFVQDRKESH